MSSVAASYILERNQSIEPCCSVHGRSKQLCPNYAETNEDPRVVAV